MGVGVNSGLRHAPGWTPHRINVIAADAVPTNIKAGMVSEPYEDVFADVKLSGGVGPITIDVLFWSELSSSYVAQQPAVQFTGIAASKMLKFNAGGNRFFLQVTGTFGGTRVDINCAGANPVMDQSA